jgi:hypothetical protein
MAVLTNYRILTQQKPRNDMCGEGGGSYDVIPPTWCADMKLVCRQTVDEGNEILPAKRFSMVRSRSVDCPEYDRGPAAYVLPYRLPILILSSSKGCNSCRLQITRVYRRVRIPPG